MKKLFILFSAFFMGMNVFAQSVTVSFTGKDIDDNYVQIDSVVIIDLTESWSAKLIYPDTTADLAKVGINDYENLQHTFILSQNNPNPFNGVTDFSLSLPVRENITIEVRDLLGKKILDFNRSLDAGNHIFTISLDVPQMYLLTARTKNHTATIKMVNTVKSGQACAITYKNSDNFIQPEHKAIQSNAFSTADTMQYVVYYQGKYTTRVQTQSSSENMTYTFDPSVFVNTMPQNRTVLLEEFTGVNCGYCPDGHRRADSTVAANPGVIYNINIHAGSFAANYKTNVGALLNNYFYVTGYPTGMVSREVVNENGTYKYPISRGSWGYVAAQLYIKPSYVNVAAKTTIDVNTRQMTCTVQAYFTANSAAVNGKNYIHVALIQDSIWGPQSNGKAFYPQMWSDSLGKYCHNHMLRELILGVDGENMGGTSSGTTYQKTFTYDIPLTYQDGSNPAVDAVLEHLSVIVFITEGEPSNKEEYQYNKERVIYVNESELILTGTGD
ncbi:MAG: Omp28-related outer membrane protein [Bacteroidales bacterium]|jgi:hypothetical protein|nr:Omp28-related outer membrane protein [Bacteroidales bacterium]